MKFADLHLHSRFSDGTYAPDDLAVIGRRYGFSALALTDHDSVEGCAALGREVVPPEALWMHQASGPR